MPDKYPDFPKPRQKTRRQIDQVVPRAHFDLVYEAARTYVVEHGGIQSNTQVRLTIRLATNKVVERHGLTLVAWCELVKGLNGTQDAGRKRVEKWKRRGLYRTERPAKSAITSKDEQLAFSVALDVVSELQADTDEFVIHRQKPDLPWARPRRKAAPVNDYRWFR